MSITEQDTPAETTGTPAPKAAGDKAATWAANAAILCVLAGVVVVLAAVVRYGADTEVNHAARKVTDYSANTAAALRTATGDARKDLNLSDPSRAAAGQVLADAISGQYDDSLNGRGAALRVALAATDPDLTEDDTYLAIVATLRQYRATYAYRQADVADALREYDDATQSVWSKVSYALSEPPTGELRALSGYIRVYGNDALNVIRRQASPGPALLTVEPNGIPPRLTDDGIPLP